MFKKILIANRGEIACRAMQTAKRMGIPTVAVYSDADSRAKHVREADEAILIGAPPPGESYLVIDKIIDACKVTQADAVYPGYGFLSENAQFAERLKEEGITFIGPNVRAIEAMGDKITSKKLAEEAGVNCIPGYTAVIKDAAEAVNISNDIGYPVMLKASAGGGGKGMRVAFNDEECADGFERATSEAISSFGDDRVFIEKFIEQPRHIEIQVIADSHGKVLTLNERECSIQRRHQKVIEEAPSPFIDPATRKAMSEQAVLLSKAVDYVSAGTVELIVDKDRNFYFLEMNTRLQVEHPVTELITGLDLVELMIRVAAGEALPLEQDEIGINGWAMESRIYAESPERNFMPSIGRLRRYREPLDKNAVRVDSGVAEGDEISMFYDPMISKLITHGKTRDEAINAMNRALDEYYIKGVDTNIGFLASLLAKPQFHAGDLSTNFIAEQYPDGFDSGINRPDDLNPMVALVSSIHYRYRLRASQISGQIPNTRYTPRRDWVVVVNNNQQVPVTVQGEGTAFKVLINNTHYFIEDRWQVGDPLYRGSVNGTTISAQLSRSDYHFNVYHQGYAFDACVLTPRVAELSQWMPEVVELDMSKFVLSPMPGLLVALKVSEGESVTAGQELAIVEAMKMENSLRASADGVVKSIKAEQGATLVVDQPIIEFE